MSKGTNIQNLLNSLIGQNRFRTVFSTTYEREAFVNYAKIQLRASNVHTMSPEKLGSIMCALGTPELMASNNDLFNHAKYNGDGEEFMRELVSVSLAYAIWQKLEDEWRETA